MMTSNETVAASEPAAQLEIRFDGGPAGRTAARRQRRMDRARWWFRQMRLAVDAALSSEEAGRIRPEQIQLGLEPCRSRVTARLSGDPGLRAA